MKKVQAGFTLIELVVVIVILGILAAVALPKFIDLSGEASQAAVEGVAGSIASAAAINYAAKMAGSSKAISVKTCADAKGLVTGLKTSEYAIAASASGTEPSTAGVAVDCTVTGKNSTSAVASVVGAP